MLRCLITISFLSAALSVGIAADPTTADLYPTTVGNEWTFKNGPLEVVERVSKHEKIGADTCARVETVFNGKVLAFEHIAVRDDGVYRVAINGRVLNPPLCFMKMPPRKGTEWEIKTRVQGQDIAGRFVSDVVDVQVPAGKFRTLASRGTDFTAGEVDLEFAYYFAPKTGKVKQVVIADGKETVLELKSFTPGPVTAAAQGRVSQ